MTAAILLFPVTQQAWWRLARHLHNEARGVSRHAISTSTAFAENVAYGPDPQLMQAAATEWREERGLQSFEKGGAA